MQTDSWIPVKWVPAERTINKSASGQPKHETMYDSPLPQILRIRFFLTTSRYFRSIENCSAFFHTGPKMHAHGAKRSCLSDLFCSLPKRSAALATNLPTAQTLLA